MDGEIEDCIRREYRRLVAAVALVTGSVPAAEDSVQEAFARAWERDRRGHAFTHLAGWVATVALNHARSGHRRHEAESRAVARLAMDPRPFEPSGTDPTGDVELRVLVQAAIDDLAGRQRDAVLLHHLLDVDVATTAMLLGVSEGTVKSALSRARAHLATALSTLDQEAP